MGRGAGAKRKQPKKKAVEMRMGRKRTAEEAAPAAPDSEDEVEDWYAKATTPPVPAV